MVFTPLKSLVAAAALLAGVQAAAASASIPAPAAAAQTPAKNPATLRVLSNGLRVLVVENHLAPVAETAVYYNFGAYDEVAGKTGLAHALEHMMFRGTAELSGDGLTDALTQLGGTMNASTFPDYTRFYFVVPSEQLELALHIEADRMASAQLNPRDWERERGAVLTEIVGKDGSTAGLLRAKMLEAAFGKGSRYALDVGGDPQDVRSATADDLRTYYRRWYAPNNATLVVTGDVRPAAVIAAAQRLFGGIARRPVPAHVRPVPALQFGQAVSLHGDYAFGFVDAAYPFVGDVGGRETDAASLLPPIINNARSPFYAALVLSGIAYAVSASPDTTLHTGLLYVSVTVKPGHTTEEAARVLDRTMAQFVADGPVPALVAAAKEEVATQETYKRDSIPGLGYVDGYVVGYEGHDDPGHDAAQIAKVTVDDVRAAAQRYLRRPAVVGTIVPDGTPPQAPATPAPLQINDTFGSGEGTAVVQPQWVRSALARTLVARNRTRPVAFTLGNGMHVYVQPVSGNATVYVSGTVNGSPRFDPSRKEGTGLMTGALLGYGSEKYDFLERSRVADDLSASINLGQTFSAYGLAKDFPKLADVLADGVMHPRIAPAYFDLVKSGFAAAVQRAEHSPEVMAGRALTEMLVPPGDPALREPTARSIGAISRDDVLAYHRTYYRPDLTRITVVGNVTPAQVRAVLENAFGSWRAEGPTPDVSIGPLELRDGRTQTFESTGTTVNVTLAQAAPPRTSPDFYPLLVLDTILGANGELSSRLMQSLRVRRGLVYGVSSEYSAQRERGTLFFSLTATPSNVRRAVSLLKNELQRAQREAPDPVELERAKKSIIGRALVAEDSIGGLASAVNNIGDAGLPLDYYQTRSALFNAVTAADVLRVARTYLRPSTMAEVYQGPPF